MYFEINHIGTHFHSKTRCPFFLYLSDPFSLCATAGHGSTSGQPANWQKCDAVAKLIANCPLQSDSLDSYYSLICPQVGLKQLEALTSFCLFHVIHFVTRHYSQSHVLNYK